MTDVIYLKQPAFAVSVLSLFERFAVCSGGMSIFGNSREACEGMNGSCMLGKVVMCALLSRPTDVRAVHPWVGGLWARGISTRQVT
jgi:hypothetical protein